MLEVLAIMRFVAGALVASYGLAKLLAFPASIDSIWRPDRVRRPVALAMGAVVSGIEIAL